MSLSFDNTQIAFQHCSNKDLKLAHFIFSSLSAPFITRAGMCVAKFTVKWNLPFDAIIKNTIFRQFCGGENLREAIVTTSELEKYSVAVALDYGVEGKKTESDFDHAVSEFIRVIRQASSHKNIPFIPIKITGFARFRLLEKLDAGENLTDPEVAEWKRVQQRIESICSAADEHGVMILIDAEQSWIQHPVDELALRMMERFNKGKLTVFNTFQMYRHDRLAYLKTAQEHSLQSGYVLGAKLVRGAYMETERERAVEKGYPSPIHADKAATDAHYNEAVSFCLAHYPQIGLFIGTHNEHSCMEAVRKMKEAGLPPETPNIFFSQLYGMSDNITFNLAATGYHASKYLPYGPVKEVIPYLMRRAEENSSIAGQTGRELLLIKREMRRRKI